MRWSTVLLLALAVGGLAFLVRKRAEERAQGIGIDPEQYYVAPEFAPERVTSIFIDNTERSVQIGLERDAIGAWYLTDPIAYAASQSVVDTLLRTVAGAQGEVSEVSEGEGLGLSPGKVLLRLTQAPGEEGGEERVYRIEVGAVDLMADRVYVRAHDHPAFAQGGQPGAGILRATRTLYTTLDRNPDDFRDTRATPFLGQRVVAFERTGQVWLPDRERVVDLELDAQRAGDRWDRRNPPRVRLDPNAMGLLARGGAELRVRGFEADAPVSLEPYGLDDPAFSVTLEDATGDRVSLLFGFPRPVGPGHDWSELWYCKRVGTDVVWWLEDTEVLLLVRPAEDLFDYFLVRARRESIQRVDLTDAGRTLSLERLDGTQEWEVYETLPDADGGVPQVGPRFRASTAQVQDVLAKLEASELDYPDGVAFEPVEGGASIRITTDDGELWGGDVGQVWRDAERGATGRQFRRFGDELAGVLPEDVADLLAIELGDLRRSRVHRVRAVDVSSVALEYDGRRFVYTHPDERRWLVQSSSLSAPRAFTELIDHLFSLRASEWLEGTPSDAGDAIEILITSREDEEIRFRLARGPGGELLCEENGAWCELDVQAQRELWGMDLGERVQALFEGQ